MRFALCKTCLSLPRYENVDTLFPSVGCGQDCNACQTYMAGNEGSVIWLSEKDERFQVLTIGDPS